MQFDCQSADSSLGDREEGHHDDAVVSCRMVALDDDGSESLSLSPPLKRCVVEDRETGLMLTDDDNGQRRIKSNVLL